MEELQKKYDTLVGKYNALLAENEELKSILLQHGIVYSVSEISDKEPIFSPVIFQRKNGCFCTKMVQQDNGKGRLSTGLYQ